MSLLWPRPLHINLFPGTCRLESRYLASAHIFNLDADDKLEQILQKLDAQLTDQSALISKHKTVQFTLSDHFSVVSLMPWQDALSSLDEISNYAYLCLESKATLLNGDWVKHAEFDAYQQPGIAYAFPQALLAGLDSICLKHHLKILQTLPLSARVFFRRLKKVRNTQQIALLIESTRSTIVSYANNRIFEMDVEPVLDSSIKSIDRLLRRLELNDNEALSILVWSNDEMINPEITPLIESLYSNVTLTNLPYHFWRGQ